MTDCKKTSSYVMAKTYKDMINNKDLEGLIEYTDTEGNKLNDAINQYLKDCQKCNQETNNSGECHNTASTKLSRSMPYAYKNIYPWRNYDWNYANFIDNNYSTLSTGATKEGSYNAMKRNFNAFRKIVGAFLEEPNPNPKSKAGNRTKNDDYPYYECTDGIKDLNGQLLNRPQDTKRCRVIHNIKYDKPEKPPTVDNFFKDNNKIIGERASSYYVKVGNCPRPDIKSKSDCEKKGYFWNLLDGNGSCIQPRYAYMDNTPGYTIGGKKWQGLVPSIAKDFLSLTPDKIISVAMGENVDGVYEIQPCPKVDNNEGFTSNQLSIPTNYHFHSFYGLLLLFLTFILFRLFIQKK